MLSGLAYQGGEAFNTVWDYLFEWVNACSLQASALRLSMFVHSL